MLRVVAGTGGRENMLGALPSFHLAYGAVVTSNGHDLVPGMAALPLTLIPGGPGRFCVDPAPAAPELSNPSDSWVGPAPD